MKRLNKKRTILTFGLSLLAFTLLLLFCLRLMGGRAHEEDTSFVSQADLGNLETVFFQGREYMLNPFLRNILFLGIDVSSQDIEESSAPRRLGQADAIMLITLDDSNQSAKVLHISRDTMTEIASYDIFGQVYARERGQLALQHARGRGGHGSSLAMEQTVSRLLYDLPIDAYLALHLDGVALLTEAVGGVTITMPEDYRHIDLAFYKGAQVTLTGEQAKAFVMFRDITTSGANQDRLNRQQLFITGFFQALRAGKDRSFQEKQVLYALMQPFLATNLSAEEIWSLLEFDFDVSQTAFLPGQTHLGERYDEFIVDEEALQELLIERFYLPHL